MSLKAELEAWASALKSYDEDDLEGALDQFSAIAETSKIFVNIGLIHATLGEHEIAVEQFHAAVELDKYLAIAYFQSGVSNFLLGRYELALADFEDALLYLRGNSNINYEQLGLKFKLFSAEVNFNKGLSLIYMGRVDEGLGELQIARSEKVTDEHNVIDEAISNKGDGYTVFSIPVGILYRPSESKLKNAKTKDYMGKAKLVAAADSNDAFTTFTGVTRLRQGVTPSASSYVDRPDAALSRSATAPTRKLEPNPAVLARANTTINVTSTPRERAAALTAPPASPSPAPGLGRSASVATPAAPKGLARSNTSLPSSAGSVRGLNLKKSSEPRASPPPPPIQEQPEGEFYDDYLDAYHEEEEPPAVISKSDRIAAWAQKTTAKPGMGRSASSATRPPAAPSSYAASSYGGGSMRRKVTRRNTYKKAPTVYEGEDDQYDSGEDDAPFELVKIRVKLHYQDDIRGMALDPEVPFEEFIDLVTAKFNMDVHGLGMKFTDEDGGKVSLRDESDYAMAIETARESAQGKPEGKLEVWCVNL